MQKSKWSISSAQYSILASTMASMFLWGVILSLGSLSASGRLISMLSSTQKMIILLVGPLFLLLGDFTVGVMSDRLGRKTMFMVTMFSYGTGILAIILSTCIDDFIGIVAGLALSEFGIGGEEPPALSLITENFSVDTRAFFLTFVTNFGNIGSAFMSGLLLFMPSSFTFYAIMGTGIAILAVLVAARLSMPESYRWLREKGREEEAIKERSRLNITNEGVARKHPGYLIPMIALIIMGISQYLTYGLMSFVIGPYEFPSVVFDEEIILYSNLGAAVGGVIAAYVINAVSRKMFTFWAFFGGLVTTLAIAILWRELKDPMVFFPLLFANMIMSEFAWAARITLEPESFPTELRSTAIGIIRIFPIVTYEVSVYLASGLSLSQYLDYNAVLWGIGLVGAVFWLVKGFETKDINPDYQV